jgi:hypothetical protein
MVVPFGSARERRSRTTYRPTVTPEGSTHVDTFTGTTSSVSRTAAGKLAVVAVVRQRVIAQDTTGQTLNGLLVDSRWSAAESTRQNAVPPVGFEPTLEPF